MENNDGMIVCIEKHGDKTKVIVLGVVDEDRSYRNCNDRKNSKYSYECVKVK
ncbi:MAG TPA: hypothetical protein VKA95_09890 [Nitrososphaeraceae archaeon]|nr:hypothetical protein [Nitrososphaeraceae archaeon]